MRACYFWTVFVAAALAGVLAGCTDRGACLRSHAEQQMTLVPIFTGNTTNFIPIWSPVTVCDAWEFPSGRPATK